MKKTKTGVRKTTKKKKKDIIKEAVNTRKTKRRIKRMKPQKKRK